MKEGLLATGDFASERPLQRLTYSDPVAKFSMPVDLIPFRGVASADSTIEWPPRRGIVMNVAGFEEALASSVSIEIESELVIRVASLSGLTLLKLVAWSDRGRETNKDAADLYRLLTTYADAGNTERLYDNEMDLLESVDFDMALAGAELLGGDVARLCSSPVLIHVRELLNSESNLGRLVRQMVQTSTYVEATPGVERIASSFRRGLAIDI